jgi:hypothetical protein
VPTKNTTYTNSESSHPFGAVSEGGLSDENSLICREQTGGLPRLSDRLQVIYKSHLPAGEKALLAYLAFRIDAIKGSTWVGISRMALETGSSVSTVKLRLNRLKKLGWIQRTRRPNKSSITTILPQPFLQRNASPPVASGTVDSGPSGGPHAGPPPGSQQARCRSSGDRSTAYNEPVSGFDSSIPSGKQASVEDFGTDLFKNLFEELKATTGPYLTRKQFCWMLAQIQSRSKSNPRTPAYWLKSTRGFVAAFEEEMSKFLTTEAEALLVRAAAQGEICEHLKCLAAGNDLPTTPDFILKAIDRAVLRLRERPFTR